MYDVLVDGVVVQITQEEIDAVSYESPDSKARRVRQERDNLLAETDWCANSDVIMSDDMTTYRQALRDITDQSGFPTNITWPTKP
jgi:hypothetical protein